MVMKKTCCSHKLDLKKAQELLSTHQISRTKIKTHILISLSQSNHPLSVLEIFESFKKDTCDISTVFRTITQFKEKGLVKEINLGESFFRYETINHTSDHHHHHIRCRDCGNIKLIEKCDLSVLEKMVNRLGFKNVEHHLEFIGQCSECA